MAAEAMSQWSYVADDDLRDAIGAACLVAIGELYRRHGTAALNVAAAITQDAGLAERAVVTTFVGLAAAVRGDDGRPLRAQLLDAIRRSAGDLADKAAGGRPALHSVGRGEVFRSLPLEARSVLALAVAGRCGDAEIAQITGLETSAVRHTLRVALDHAKHLLGDRRQNRAF